MVRGPPDPRPIDVGEIIEHPLSGERIVFRRTAASTDGEAVVIEAHLRPGGQGPGSFRHPRQQARFQVLRGRLGLRVGERDLRLGPGERLTIPADAEYAYWNAGSEPALVVAEVRPALDFEALLTRLFTTPEETS